MMKRTNRIAPALGAWLLGAACLVAGAAHAQDEVVARGAGAAVTRAELAGLSRSLSPEGRARLLADAAARDQVVRTLLAQKAVLAEAKAKGWDKQPLVQAAIEQAQREVLLQSYLAALSEPAADYPPEPEIQAAYERNRATFMAPRALHLAQLYVALPPGADAAAVDGAQKKSADLARRAQARGADFEALAKMYSEDKASAARGGDLGFVPETMIQPAVLAAANALKRGEVSAPVRTPTGFHVLKLVEVREAALRPLDEVRAQIRAALREQRAQQNVQAYLAKLAAADAVSIDDEALKKALVPSQ
ncbi:peptidylprolyl isomerase [Cupriavidus sp. USMAHM13]|uniref:peptidylprolyl isomerase n=1 Tax=Cupriavidus sp. USMAHM13 TaxID=1389192 RepID=UPI0008A70359|nr:peptidylprolyl isomerase [Cupriavidus sp. USMAHM13]AOZ03696.1 peptidylprolyl isomerase [Cupriavidus sp. USMAHM13]